MITEVRSSVLQSYRVTMSLVHFLEHLNNIGVEVELWVVHNSQCIELESQGAFPDHKLRRVSPVQTVHAVYPHYPGLVPPGAVRTVEPAPHPLPVGVGPDLVAVELGPAVEEPVQLNHSLGQILQQVNDAPLFRARDACHVAVQVVYSEVGGQELVQIPDLERLNSNNSAVSLLTN